MRRVRHAILILLGREPYGFSTELMEFKMALDNFNAAVADLGGKLNDAADALIQKAAADATALAQAQSDVTNADQTATEAFTGAVQPVIDKLNNAVQPSA